VDLYSASSWTHL